MPRQTPFRPRQKAEISQAYNDGIVTIYTETDGAGSGRLPVPSLEKIVSLAYQERKLGIRRYYDAKQNQIHVERVIRIQRPPISITSQNTAQTEDGKNYRIDLIQIVADVFPPSLDLTLVEYSQNAPPKPLPPIQEGGGLDV